MTNDTVIEVRGGCVAAVYSGDREQRFILLDWDDLNELPEGERLPSMFHPQRVDEMPCDTRRVYERGAAEDRDRVQ
jgi:hypothetical protein